VSLAQSASGGVRKYGSVEAASGAAASDGSRIPICARARDMRGKTTTKAQQDDHE
jgi:hypothetical protein